GRSPPASIVLSHFLMSGTCSTALHAALQPVPPVRRRHFQSLSFSWVWPALIGRARRNSSGSLVHIALQRRLRKGARRKRLNGLSRRQRTSQGCIIWNMVEQGGAADILGISQR